MKYLFTICLILTSVFAANAQSSAKTLKWLNNERENIIKPCSNQVPDYVKSTIIFTEEYIKLYYNEDGESDETIIYWKQIKEIVQNKGDHRGTIRIDIGDTRTFAPTYMLFLYKGSVTDFTKRLARMANLNGANAVIQTTSYTAESLFGSKG
ncbi:hypothetical protein DBR32_14070 [Taibaiella sp. KBW10]|uniref:hypothetical protein n=1 Tax=Taibaiella sp. KBW10 TaxID=2153357 RepID=UPI000F5B824B|nr:hypothetical protein [Taibaiella sp. KBW10]RQO30028.1 hypothetical protein DBR32_14070 [Taibaiella sp. KBW10]